MISKQIKVKNGVIELNGKKIPLISGEFHYWRNFPDQWQVILDRIKEMGLRVVSTYVPWNYHELKPGVYDFEGRTSSRRNLKSFIELIKEMGLYLIVRPGPYIYSEWPHGGPPEYAVKYHRLDPEFLKYAKDYILNVCQVLVPYQVTEGGNIIMIQADNEPYPPVESFGEEMGCFGGSGMFKDWLKKRYNNDINKLNKSWKTDYYSFDQACFYFHESYVDVTRSMAGRLLLHEAYYWRYADSHAFIGWYAQKIVETVAQWLGEAGIKVPVYANGWSPYYQDFHALSSVVDVVGIDIYPLEYIKGNKVTEDEWLYNIDHIKLAKGELGYCWSAEFQSGVYPINFTGYLAPNHFRYVAFSAMANGLSGWNWYMLVNRDNWYNCPINEWGRPNEYFPIHKEIVQVAHEVKPWQLGELTDVSLLVYKPHKVISPGNWKNVFYALNEADMDFLEYNPDTGKLPQTKSLIYAGSNWLPRKIQQQLLRYVHDGGTLILFNEFPEKDEFDDDINILGLKSPEGARPVILPVSIWSDKHQVQIENAGHLGNKVNFFYYNAVDGQPIMLSASREAKEALVDIGAVKEKSFIIGYKKQMGKGSVIHIGSNPSGSLIRLALNIGDLSWYVRTSTPGVLTNVYKDGEGGPFILYVNNRDEAAKEVAVALQSEALGIKDKEIFKGEEVTGKTKCKVQGDTLSLNVKGNSVSIWRLKIHKEGK